MPTSLKQAASGLMLLCVVGTARSDSLAELWSAGRQGGVYREPERRELREAEELFLRTLRGQDELDRLKQDWRKLHFELATHAENDVEYLVLREAERQRTGRGVYIFRRGKAPAIVLQAPHSGADAHTGTLALKLLQEGQILAGAWNAVPRSGVDLAHVKESYFQSFTAAFIRAQPRGLVLQLHGFDGDKRKTEAALNADAICSNGTRQPPPWLLHFAHGLKKNTRWNVTVYPNDVHELGGTTNAQAQLFTQEKHNGFLHLEMSLDLRKTLRDDPKLRQTLLQCLIEVYQKDRATSDKADPASK